MTMLSASWIKASVAGLLLSSILMLTATPLESIAARRPLDLTYIHMIDGTVGWADSTNALWHTTDGGVTWTDATPPGGFVGTYGDESATDFFTIRDAAFLTGRRAWVAGMSATISRTNDGGHTWLRVRVPLAIATIAQLTFIDPLHGWALARGDAAAGSQAVQILRTVDGGVTWTSISLTEYGHETPGSLALVGGKSGLGFRDPKVGFATGSGPLPGVAVLSMSPDGGQTWQSHALPVPPGYSQDVLTTGPPYFFTVRDGVLPANVRPHQFFYATHDGGRTWAAGAELPAGSTWSFADPVHGWALDEGSTRLLVTRDGSRRWTVLPSNLSGLAGGDSGILDFVTTNVGFALISRPNPMSNALLKTVDGGHIWRVMHPCAASC